MKECSARYLLSNPQIRQAHQKQGETVRAKGSLRGHDDYRQWGVLEGILD